MSHAYFNPEEIKGMTKTELKQFAQEQIMHCVMTIYYQIGDSNTSKEDLKPLKEEVDRQVHRIEKLFGYEPGSFKA